MFEKRWQYLCISAGDLFFSSAIVDTGLAGTAFYHLANLKTGKVLADGSCLGVSRWMVQINSRPTQGAHAWFRRHSLNIELSRSETSDHFDYLLESPDLKIKAQLFEDPQTRSVCVAARPETNTLTLTQKTSPLRVEGTILCHGQTYPLHSALAGMDFTSGHLPKVTDWRWSFALGNTAEHGFIAFNLAEGNHLGESRENTLWLGGQLYPLSPVSFHFARNSPTAAWKIKTQDRSLNLTFTPKSIHREDRDLIVASSRFAQLTGIFSGTIRHPSLPNPEIRIQNLPGVSEDQRVKW
ncbi:DUF2804 domain-containing protein [Bdellovibrionota bacterium FG-1]